MADIQRGLLSAGGGQVIDTERIVSYIRGFLEASGISAPLALIASWFALFLAVPKFVWMVLVPSWYLLPAAGENYSASWMRAVRVYLNDSTLNMLPGVTLIGLSMLLFVLRSRGNGRLDRLAVGFAASNLFSLPLGYLLILLANIITHWIYPGHPTPADGIYQEMALPAAAMVTVFGLLLLAQAKLPFQQEHQHSSI